MTTTPRKDYTRAARSARRQALLDVAARRFGLESWSSFESAIRQAVEKSEDNSDLQENLAFELLGAREALMETDRSPEPAQDLLEALAAHPRKPRW